MSRRIARPLLVAVALVSALPGPTEAFADVGGPDDSPQDGSTGVGASGDGIDAEAELETVESGGREGSSGPRCEYEPLRRDPSLPEIDENNAGVYGLEPGVGAVFNPETGLYERERNGQQEAAYTRRCDGEEPVLVMVPRVSVEDVRRRALQRVTQQLPSPSMDMSPAPEIGGYVNFGMWLAVADPGPVSITAQVGPVWATVTATYVSTTWDMGNGDVVECDGVGTPIVDPDTMEQGPCGYTYRWASTPEATGADGLAYHVTVTGHWEITYQTSTGTSGSLAPLTRTTTFTYQVREIQTVRVAG